MCDFTGWWMQPFSAAKTELSHSRSACLHTAAASWAAISLQLRGGGVFVAFSFIFGVLFDKLSNSFIGLEQQRASLFTSFSRVMTGRDRYAGLSVTTSSADLCRPHWPEQLCFFMSHCLKLGFASVWQRRVWPLHPSVTSISPHLIRLIVFTSSKAELASILWYIMVYNSNVGQNTAGCHRLPVCVQSESIHSRFSFSNSDCAENISDSAMSLDLFHV